MSEEDERLGEGGLCLYRMAGEEWLIIMAGRAGIKGGVGVACKEPKRTYGISDGVSGLDAGGGTLMSIGAVCCCDIVAVVVKVFGKW